MSRLKDLRIVDPVLTSIVRGYKNAQFVGTKILPILNVEKEGGKIVTFGKDAFKLYNTKRAVGGNSNRKTSEKTTTTDYVMEEHDIEQALDYREQNESMFDEEKRAGKHTKDIIDLGLEKDIADITQNLSTYPSGHKVTLSGNDKWTDYTNSDPVADIEDGKDAIRSAIGSRPNVAIMGASVFKTLKSHKKLIELIKYSQKGIVTIDLMKELFGFEQLYVGEAIYADDAGTFSDIWSDNFVMGYVPSDPAAEVPSFGYTLKKKAYPQTDTYMDNGGKIKVVRTTDFYVPKVLGSSAGYIINDVN